MKRTLIITLICALAASLFAQYESPFQIPEKRNCMTIGILNGGGSLVGFDFEFLVSDQVGLQLGAGFHRIRRRN